MRAALSLALMVLAVPAAAQQAPSPHQRAIAAGYKAAMLCSGLFVAGRTREQVEALELTGIYPDYDPIVPTLAASVDPARGQVAVAYDAAMPPRLAQWRADGGCTTLPIGAAGTVPARAVTPPRPAGADPRRWPQGDAGIAPRPSAALAAAVAKAFEPAGYGGGRTVGVVVVENGRVVAESYAEGFDPFTANRTWSVAKSIAGTLVGLAGIDPAAPAPVAAWQREHDPRRVITTDQLLRMTSGLGSDTAGNRTDALYFGGTAISEQAPAWPLAAPPGTRFRYANNDTLLAVLGLRETLGDERYKRFPQAALFEPLGMRHTVAETDWRGDFVLSSQVWSTARDLARLGQLWLDDGVWQGRRLLPAGWMRYMTTPSGPQPPNAGYGATLWLANPDSGLPPGTFSAQGNRGQYVVVVPSRKLVIVRRGEDPAGLRFDADGFVKAVIAASR